MPMAFNDKSSSASKKSGFTQWSFITSYGLTPEGRFYLTYPALLLMKKLSLEYLRFYIIYLRDKPNIFYDLPPRKFRHVSATFIPLCRLSTKPLNIHKSSLASKLPLYVPIPIEEIYNFWLCKHFL